MTNLFLNFFLQKVNRRMHLSKVKHSKFNESGQLMAFYAISAFWSADIIIRVSIIGFCVLTTLIYNRNLMIRNCKNLNFLQVAAL